jgi:diadenosine tetraphosphatase ApaH/serine/threonine PP2A family protein phosphatase
MRRAIISDIHANLVALESVLADCDERKVDEIVCLGDICGYGPDPIQCVDLIRARCKWSLCGNHDAALFMSVAIGFNRFAREAIEWQRRLLMPRWYSLPATTDRWHWLENLAASRTEGKTLYVHASPRDPLMEYVEESDFADMGFGPSQKGVEMMEKVDELAFCGHSHRPGIVGEDYVFTKPEALENFSFTLPVGSKVLINVGSVGQPRDNNPKSCYVIFDDQARTVAYRRVPYDIRAAQECFKTVPELNERLWKRLETGS